MDYEMIITFVCDAMVVIQDTVDSMPYADTYKKGEIERIDILDEHNGTIHVQFEDGTVGWIKLRHVTLELIEE